MAVFRIERTRDYTVMSNHHLRNHELSLKAKGLLSMMLSLPDDWMNIIPLGSHQFPASEPPGNGIFHLQSHHNILWQHTYLISL